MTAKELKEYLEEMIGLYPYEDIEIVSPCGENLDEVVMMYFEDIQFYKEDKRRRGKCLLIASREELNDKYNAVFSPIVKFD